MAVAHPMRKLAAIMAADVVGFSRLMGADETGTLRRLSVARSDIIDPLIAAHHGRVFKVMGDGLLIEFPSAVLALSCAVDIQNRLDASNFDLAPEERIVLRIGLHQGDVVVEDADLLGDGVNVAARLEPLAEPGGICISDRVREDAAGKLTLEMEDLGERQLKNIRQPVRVHRVRLAMRTSHPLSPGSAEAEPPSARPANAVPAKPAIAVLPFDTLGGAADAQQHFATGLAEDIITALSRLRWLSVVPRNLSFAVQGRATDFRRIARDLAVRYVITGSVRQSGDRVRVTAQLIEARTGEHLWADRHESIESDVFDLQDHIAHLVSDAVSDRLAPGGPPTRPTQPGGEDLQTMVLRGGTLHSLSVLGEEPLRRLSIGSVPLTIGRLPPSHFILSGGEVSRAHCRLNLIGDEVVLTDLGSTNGTFVDDRRISTPTVLPHGAKLRIGAHVMLYECAGGDGEATGLKLEGRRAALSTEPPDQTFRP